MIIIIAICLSNHDQKAEVSRPTLAFYTALQYYMHFRQKRHNAFRSQDAINIRPLARVTIFTFSALVQLCLLACGDSLPLTGNPTTWVRSQVGHLFFPIESLMWSLFFFYIFLYYH